MARASSSPRSQRRPGAASRRGLRPQGERAAGEVGGLYRIEGERACRGSLPELLGVPPDEKVELAGVVVDGSVLQSCAKGAPVVLEKALPTEGAVTEQRRRRIRPLAQAYGLKSDDETLTYLAQTSLMSTETKAARSLGVWSTRRGALEVAAAALSLWGHSLTEERNKR